MSSEKARDFLYTVWFENESSYYVFVLDVSEETGDGKAFRYATGQLERAPSTGRLHGQCFVQFYQQQRPSRFGAVLKLSGDRFHFERRRGTVREAIAYCQKEDTRVSGPFEFGRASGGQGCRTDLASATELIVGGGSLKRLAEEQPQMVVKYHRGFTVLRDLLQSDCSGGYSPKDVRVFFGPTGTGKTRGAYALYPHLCRLPVASESSPWFDGYDGQDEVLIDDYGRSSRYSYQFFLQLLDGYPMKVPIKGGFVHWVPKVVLITSNERPEDWYGDRPEVAALVRRISIVVLYPIPADDVIVPATP